MLEVDYSTKLGEMIHAVQWDIELPIEWAGYFEERGEVPCFAEDERMNQRLKIRTHGLLYFDGMLPFCTRSEDPIGVYTRDFSCQGCGILASFELYPEEIIRIVLPSFWVRMQVVRSRRITSKCYEVGATLMDRYEPHMDAFSPAEQNELCA